MRVSFEKRSQDICFYAKIVYMQFLYERFYVVTYERSVYSWKPGTDCEHRD